jgi:hypothetical protein
MKVPCAECHSPIEWPEIVPQLLENKSVSVIVVNHGATGFCPTCQKKVAISVRHVNTQLAAIPVVEERKSPIILAPASALPPRNGGHG